MGDRNVVGETVTMAHSFALDASRRVDVDSEELVAALLM